MKRQVLTHQPAVGAADLTADVCQVPKFILPSHAELAGARSAQPHRSPSTPQNGRHSSSLGLPTPSAQPPSHTIRDPIHLTQVPRG